MRVETLATWVACAAVSVSAAASVANESDAQVQATINASPECAVSIFNLPSTETYPDGCNSKDVLLRHCIRIATCKMKKAAFAILKISTRI